MPVYRQQTNTVRNAELVHVITEELKRDDPAAADARAPVIIIQPTFGGHETVTVIWDDERWAALTREDRGEIIMDSYDSAYGKNAMLKIMYAFGLTNAEARSMGIEIPA